MLPTYSPKNRLLPGLASIPGLGRSPGEGNGDPLQYSGLENSWSVFSSVAQSCLILCDPVNCSTPGLPVHHQLPEFTQTHVHRVGDAIQPSHPLSSSHPNLNSESYQPSHILLSSKKHCQVGECR